MNDERAKRRAVLDAFMSGVAGTLGTDDLAPEDMADVVLQCADGLRAVVASWKTGAKPSSGKRRGRPPKARDDAADDKQTSIPGAT